MSFFADAYPRQIDVLTHISPFWRTYESNDSSNDRANMPGYVFQRFLWIRPSGDGFGTRWEKLESGEWCILPIHRTQENWEHMRPSLRVHLQGSLHLHTIAIVGVHKIRAHQEQDNARCVQMLLNFALPFRSGLNLSIIPACHLPRPLKHPQMLVNAVSQIAVLVRVSVEKPARARLGRG